MDMKERGEVILIIGWPFLSESKAIIDVHKGRLKLGSKWSKRTQNFICIILHLKGTGKEELMKIFRGCQQENLKEKWCDKTKVMNLKPIE